MPDPSQSITPTGGHMTTVEIITTAATVAAGVITGVVTQAYRFGTRMKALEEEVDAFKKANADFGRIRDEWAAQKAEMTAAMARASGGSVDPAQLSASVNAAVTNAMAGVQRDVTRIEEQHRSTKSELDRLRDKTDEAEKEGAKRWSDMSRDLGSITRALREP